MANQITEKEYNALNKAAAEYLTEGKISQKCPRCGKNVKYESNGTLEIIHCEDKTCIKSIRRGI